MVEMPYYSRYAILMVNTTSLRNTLRTFVCKGRPVEFERVVVAETVAVLVEQCPRKHG